MNKTDLIALTCLALSRHDRKEAAVHAREYPLTPVNTNGRRYTELQMTKIFVRDGFIDRYTGARLVFPGTLRLLSLLMPEEFPFQTNWKMTVCHPAYWELFPTVDHVIPIARGGADDESNWLTTSMLKNSAKGNWTLNELGWSLFPPGPMNEWDGLVSWFLDYTTANPESLANGYLKRWRSAACKILLPPHIALTPISREPVGG